MVWYWMYCYWNYSQTPPKFWYIPREIKTIGNLNFFVSAITA